MNPDGEILNDLSTSGDTENQWFRLCDDLIRETSVTGWTTADKDAMLALSDAKGSDQNFYGMGKITVGDVARAEALV